MKFKKAILWGITAIVIIYCLILILQAATGLWQPLVETIGVKNATLKWMISLGLTIVAIALVGYTIVILHPFKIIALRMLGIKEREAKSVVLVEWGGNWFYGWLTGTIEINGEIFYRVTVPSAPLPLSGQLMIVRCNRIIFTDITMPEHLSQLASMGFNGMRDDINTRLPPPDQD